MSLYVYVCVCAHVRMRGSIEFPPPSVHAVCTLTAGVSDQHKWGKDQVHTDSYMCMAQASLVLSGAIAGLVNLVMCMAYSVA